MPLHNSAASRLWIKVHTNSCLSLSLVVEDRVSDDMVMTVPLDINPLQIGVSANTLSLCYQVHGEEDKFYNLLSDDCVSVNAHVSQPYADRHIIDKIGIRAVGNNETCYDISIERQNCAVSINNQSLQINTRFQEEGIKVFIESLMEIPTIHVSVPNCGKPTIDHMFISCTEYTVRDTPIDILQFGSTRGKSQVQPPHGLIGTSVRSTNFLPIYLCIFSPFFLSFVLHI